MNSPRRGIAQPGRAPALGAGGRGFESLCPDQPARRSRQRQKTMTKLMQAPARPRLAGNCCEQPMTARIYRPTQTAMQSGPARTKEWVLEYEPEAPREIDPLMGWTS